MTERTQQKAPLVIHKEGEEGVIHVHPLTGQILTELDQRPDWADGLAAALIAERATFYEQRFGKDSTAFKNVMAADAIEFKDMSWLGVNDNQQEVEIEADQEHRSEIVAKALGINTESGEMGQTLAEVEIDNQRGKRTDSEARALNEAIEQGFGEQQQGEQKQRATGGN